MNTVEMEQLVTLTSKAISPAWHFEAVVLSKAYCESGQPQAGVSLVTMLVSSVVSDASSHCGGGH